MWRLTADYDAVMQFNLSADKKELPADVVSDMVAMHFIRILRILSAYLWLVPISTFES